MTRKGILTITVDNDANNDGTGLCHSATVIEFEPPFVGDEHETSLVASLVGQMLSLIVDQSDEVEGTVIPTVVN